jgi:hypothetical protein
MTTETNTPEIKAPEFLPDLKPSTTSWCIASRSDVGLHALTGSLDGMPSGPAPEKNGHYIYEGTTEGGEWQPITDDEQSRWRDFLKAQQEHAKGEGGR